MVGRIVSQVFELGGFGPAYDALYGKLSLMVLRFQPLAEMWPSPFSPVGLSFAYHPVSPHYFVLYLYKDIMFGKQHSHRFSFREITRLIAHLLSWCFDSPLQTTQYSNKSNLSRISTGAKCIRWVGILRSSLVGAFSLSNSGDANCHAQATTSSIWTANRLRGGNYTFKERAANEKEVRVGFFSFFRAAFCVEHSSFLLKDGIPL